MRAFRRSSRGLDNLQPVAHTGPRFGIGDAVIEFGTLRSNGTGGLRPFAPTRSTTGPATPISMRRIIRIPTMGRRFAMLGWVASLLAQGADPAWLPDVVHAHDWHAGLAAAYLRAATAAQHRRLPASILTVHNLAYQGVFPAALFGELGLPPWFYGIDGAEFYGQVSFLKAGSSSRTRSRRSARPMRRKSRHPRRAQGSTGCCAGARMT